jgi:predicted DNA-binding transcriptional regulator AlpA
MMPSKPPVDRDQHEKKSMPARRMLRANEAAERYSVGESSLWRWAREGRLHPVRHGTHLTLWSVDELEAYFSGKRGISHDQP